MIHQYRSNGYNIVMDINSGAVHIVDDVVYDVLPLLEEKKREEDILAVLSGIRKKRFGRLFLNAGSWKRRASCLRRMSMRMLSKIFRTVLQW